MQLPSILHNNNTSPSNTKKQQQQQLYDPYYVAPYIDYSKMIDQLSSPRFKIFKGEEEIDVSPKKKQEKIVLIPDCPIGVPALLKKSMPTIILQDDKERKLNRTEFKMADDRARLTPTTATSDTVSLIYFLTKGFATEATKARAIYSWICMHVGYDVEGRFKTGEVEIEVDQVLKKRKTVAEGFANLFFECARRAGLTSKILQGYTRSVPFQYGEGFSVTPHYWYDNSRLILTNCIKECCAY